MSVQQVAATVPAPAASPYRPRTWLRRITTGGQIIETCPEWCTDSHLNDHTDTSLDDLQHGTSLPGVEVPVSDWQGGTVPMPLLAPRIAVDPYSTDPERRTPHLLIEVAEDQFTAPLDPAGALAVIGQARAHLDRLERVVLGQLIAARAEVGVI